MVSIGVYFLRLTSILDQSARTTNLTDRDLLEGFARVTYT